MPPTLKERLNKLEEELDQLLSLQETIKNQSKANFSPPAVVQRREDITPQQCPCVNVTSRLRTLVSNRSGSAVSHCSLNSSSVPLSDITKFLQLISANLSKGTQAVTKIANSTCQPRLNTGHENNPALHGISNKIDDNFSGFPNVWKTSAGRKLDEDALFKELREEKDKRMRAENQAKSLKDELKKTKCELQQKADQTIVMLKADLKEALEKCELTKNELKKQSQDCQAVDLLWPFKYDTACKELEEEKSRRNQAERSVQQLQEMLQKQHVDVEEHFTLQRTANWLKDQNQTLICLTKKLQKEIGEKKGEISRKNQIIEDHLRKIKQLTCLCEQLRDHLIITRAKLASSEENLKQNLTHCQKLTDKLLDVQSALEELKKCQVQDREDQNRLRERVKDTASTNDALETRIEEMTKIMKQQNELIGRQSDTISIKEEHLRLAYANAKLQGQRIEELESKDVKAYDNKDKQLLERDNNKIMLDLEKRKETILIQEKMIEDHLQTIAQLKKTLIGKEEEINHVRRELSESGRKMAIEQTTNEQLLSKIKLLQIRKEDLKQHVGELEQELEAQISSEHTARLEQIEKQVRDKQKLWEEQKSQLMQEKEEALKTMRDCEQRLADSRAEFQADLAAQQHLRAALKSQLEEKEKEIREANEKILCLTCELQKATENAESAKKNFEAKVRSVCQAWQNTMQQLQFSE